MAESTPPSSGGNDKSAIIDAESSLPTPPLPPRKEIPALAIERRRRRPVRMYQPAKNSLYDLMHQNQGTSLYVRPIFWTIQHMRLLGVRFEELPACDTPVPFGMVDWPPSQGHMQPSPAIRTLSFSLSEITAPAYWHPVQNTYLVRTVLATLWPQTFKNTSSRLGPELHLHFGNTVYRDAVRAQLVWEYPAEGTPTSPYNLRSSKPTPELDPTGLPMMIYIGKKQLASVRRSLFRIVPGPRGSINGPVSRLQRVRAKMLTPVDKDQDPHLVGIFLSMAQRHFFKNGKTSTRRRKDFPRTSGFEDVKLRILMDDVEKEAFLIYTATITQTFIDRFIDPLSAPASDGPNGVGDIPGLKIEYTQVPFWPILGLRERLGKALGEDIVGQFNPDEVETWVDEEPVDENKGIKRKREALSEVVNGSFESETDTDSFDERPMDGKKRCLGEGPPVGMVA
jgi:hypothetical protein